MTQEEKSLLLQDLCARLPYGVCVHIRYKEGEPCYGKLTPRDIQWFIDSNIENIKPYLRPMSSMTEKEKKDYELLCDYYMDDKEEKHYFNNFATLDWLNQKHFDYRGLIKLGLAFEAPEGMYDIKD